MRPAASLRRPGVMVSSTFYDLKQIREDLRKFISDELGYTALLSEHSSFPVNPDLTTVDNCRERVRHDADILVLVIGSRYGSVVDESAKSVTNLEYLAARQKGIPVFAFVDHGVIPLLPFWEANPGAEFSKHVDTPKLFEFVNTVRNTDKVWTQEFRTAQDIIDALRIQFAYQHHRGLALLQQLRSVDGSTWIEDLRGDALRIALERPEAWEYRLFVASYISAIERHYRSREAHRQGIALGLGEDVEDPATWIRHRLSDTTRLVAAADRLISDSLPIALGPRGTPGSAEALVSIAESLGQLYGDALKWHVRVATANLDKRFRHVRELLSKMLDHVIEAMERFGPESRQEIDSVLAATAVGETRSLRLTLTFKVPDGLAEELGEEIQRLKGAS